MDPQEPITNTPTPPVEEPVISEVPKTTKDTNTITVVSMAIFVLLSLGAVAFLYYQNQQLKGMLASYQTPAASPTPIANNDPMANWKTYKNEEYGFGFKYPEDSNLESSPNGNVRIQNYMATDDSPLLKQGKYYLEFSLPPTKLTCKNQISEPARTEQGSGVIYRGLAISTGGDAGGTRFGLCAERSGDNLYIQVTENNISGTLANQILSTFKFLEVPTSSPTVTSKPSATPISY